MKLISMSDFVLENQKRLLGIEMYINYAELLKQPLELQMFVPCDEDGNVLEEPEPSNYYMHSDVAYDLYNEVLICYNEAKERCLFEGFRFVNDSVVFKEQLLIPISHFNNNTIEDLVSRYDYIQLTQTAIKQLRCIDNQ